MPLSPEPLKGVSGEESGGGANKDELAGKERVSLSLFLFLHPAASRSFWPWKKGSRRRWRKIFFEWVFRTLPPGVYSPFTSTYVARPKFAKKTFARNFFPSLFCPLSPNSNSALLRRQVHCERIARLLLLVWHAPQCGGRPTTLYISSIRFLSFLRDARKERENRGRYSPLSIIKQGGRETQPLPTRSDPRRAGLTRGRRKGCTILFC